MMQPGTMIRARVSFHSDTFPQWRIIDVSKGDVGVIVQWWRRGKQKKYMVRFLRHPDKPQWVLPGTIRRLE